MAATAAFSCVCAQAISKCVWICAKISSGPGELWRLWALSETICPNNQGLPIAPLPIMMPSAWVCVKIFAASSTLKMSPLAMTGTVQTSLTAAITDQSLLPEKPCSLVRGCTIIISAPACCIFSAKDGALMLSLSQPARILTLTGFCETSLTADTISKASSSLRIKALPSLFLVTLGTGQPMLISTAAKSESLI